jgi:alpha-L-rhamnosidase
MSGQNDLSVFLLQSRAFPSWGYEIENGATTVWERWDSFTKEDGFGRHNAAMNSFSHYAFGAVCEWMFSQLAGIQSDGPGYKKIIIRPSYARPGSNADHEPINWVKASYKSIRGTIRSQWQRGEDSFLLTVDIPANTTARLFLPASDAQSIKESGHPIEDLRSIKIVFVKDDVAELQVGSGHYEFTSQVVIPRAPTAIRSFTPPDSSPNPDNIDLTTATKVANWTLSQPDQAAKWSERKDLKIVDREGVNYIVCSGPDPQMAIELESPLQGKLVLAVRARPKRSGAFEIFWAGPEAGFSGKKNTRRPLNSTDKMNDYLFRLDDDSPIANIRIDPMDGEGEMIVESITLYQLAQ